MFLQCSQVSNVFIADLSHPTFIYRLRFLSVFKSDAMFTLKCNILILVTLNCNIIILKHILFTCISCSTFT